jgi:hypothetical protein
MTAHFSQRFSLDPLIAEAKRRARARRLLVLTLAVAAGAGAATTVALRSPERPAPTVVAADPCRITQMDLVPGRSGVAAGTYMRDFALVNESYASCTLHGWPNLRLLLGDGRMVSPRIRRDHYGTGKGIPARVIRLSPGGAASFRVAESDGTGAGTQTCRSVKAIVVSLPGAGGRLNAPNGAFYCAPYILFEAPLVAGRVDRQAGY